MVHRCCISSCKMNVRVAEAKGLSYHCFPLKDPHREKWIQAILPHVDKPENFKIVQGYTRVCSRHFRIKEYSIDSKKRARLNSNAVPSVFPRKNAPVFIQPPIIMEASTTATTKSQISKIKTPALMSNLVTSADDPGGEASTASPSSRKQSRFTAEDLIKSQQQQVHDKSQIIPLDSSNKTPTNSAPNSTADSSKNLLIFKEPSAVVDTGAEGVQQQQQEEDQHHSSDVSLDEKQDQTKRKRRKWNRTAFARNSKSKQKKSSASPAGAAINHEEDDDDDDLNDFATHLITLTRSNSLDLEQPAATTAELHEGNLGLNTPTTTAAANCLQQSTSSSSSLSMSDPLQTVEDLNNLMSVEEQELLQSIQAVSLDCGEGEMSLNMKNIHLGDHLTDPLVHHHEGLLKKVSSLIDTNGPILLEDALISSASEMSLQPKEKGTTLAAMRTPSASEIEKLASEFSSSLLTSVNNLPIDLLDDDDDDDDDDDHDRLPVSGFPNQSSISIDLPENVLVSDGEAPPPPPSVPATQSKLHSSKNNNNSSNRKSQQTTKNSSGSIPRNSSGSIPRNSSGSIPKNSSGSIPKKKLVGIQKKPKNNDKCFGKFSVERFCDSDKDIEYYTGFPTFSHFEAFFNSLQSHVEKLKVTDVMHGVADLADLIRNQDGPRSSSNNAGGSPTKDNESWKDGTEEHKRRAIIGRSMSRIDELFMTLIRLKRRLPEKVLGHMFFVSQPTVSRTIRAWTVLLSKLLEPIPSAVAAVTSEPFSIPTESSSSSSSNSKKCKTPEQNYFSSRGIYIPDSFRPLFQSDLATSIISSAHNPRSSSNPSSACNNILPTTTIVKIIATNNNNNNNNNINVNKNKKDMDGLITTAEDHSRCKCEDYPCSCGVVAGEFEGPFASVLDPCSEADIHNEFYQWGLIVKEG